MYVCMYEFQGAPPFRPLIVSFFLKIQAMAEGKLLLQVLQPNLPQQSSSYNVCTVLYMYMFLHTHDTIF